MNRRCHQIKRWIGLVAAVVLLATGCVPDSKDQSAWGEPFSTGEKEAQLLVANPETSGAAVRPLPTQLATQRTAELLNRVTVPLLNIIHNPKGTWSQKQRRVRREGQARIASALRELKSVESQLVGHAPLAQPAEKRALWGLKLARLFLNRLDQALRAPVPELPCKTDKRAPFSIVPANEVLDRYWMFYHYTEILGVFNDDTAYAHVFAPSGRTDFIAQEVGRHGIELMMDWWYLPLPIWNDPTLTTEQKLMSTKFTMWQNEDWGGGDHYINEYWSWEPGYKDEDSPLFTGNLMAALAAEYALTASQRTFSRLENLVDAVLFLDEIARDEPAFDTGINAIHGGRIQRGPKTRNLYPEDEPYLFTVTWDEQGLHTHHNNSWPDHDTGREHKNVSRDQYYGVLTGYYTIFHLFTKMPSLTAPEQALLNRVIKHCHMIVNYLTGPRYRPDYGTLYNLYAFIEGSCANPPNLSFMGYAAFVGLEEITGEPIPSNDLGYALFRALLDLGVLIGSVDLSALLFEQAQHGLTAMNQYLAALFMSDLPREHWEFIFPPALIAIGDQGQRTLWRRLIAAYALKFGDFGSVEYEEVITEMLDPANNPPVTLQTLFNSIRHDHAVIEPGGVGIEDIMWPMAFVFAAAQNQTEIGAQLHERYGALVDAGAIRLDDTDLEGL